MSDSALQDVFGSRFGLEVVLVTFFLIAILTWALTISMGEQGKHAREKMGEAEWDQSNATLPLGSP